MHVNTLIEINRRPKIAFTNLTFTYMCKQSYLYLADSPQFPIFVEVLLMLMRVEAEMAQLVEALTKISGLFYLFIS